MIVRRQTERLFPISFRSFQHLLAPALAGCRRQVLERFSAESIVDGARRLGDGGRVVIGQEFDELALASACRLLDPSRHGRMGRCALPLGQTLVGDITRQDVLEDVFGLPGDRGAEAGQHELTVLEGRKRRIDVDGAGQAME